MIGGFAIPSNRDLFVLEQNSYTDHKGKQSTETNQQFLNFLNHHSPIGIILDHDFPNRLLLVAEIRNGH